VESVAGEITGLLGDRQVHERFAGIVRENPALLNAAQSGNPFLQGVRRWWAISAAILLRRHVDGGRRDSLRDIVESLLDLPDAELSRPRENFAEQLDQLEQISDQFRPYLNAIIHGTTGLQETVTFNDLNDALTRVGAITESVYAAIANISRVVEPSIISDWTSIFQEPWILGTSEPAYALGAPGVPYDALPMSKSEMRAEAELELSFSHSGEQVLTYVKNVGVRRAIDVRVFLPYVRTVIDVGKLDVGEVASEWITAGVASTIYGQAVLEFSDIHDQVYRQYADVSVSSEIVRRLTKPFRVTGRIVESAVIDPVRR
jgi:hypothetical protein